MALAQTLNTLIARHGVIAVVFKGPGEIAHLTTTSQTSVQKRNASETSEQKMTYPLRSQQ